jgi:surface protein
MYWMFGGADAFDQNIGHWNVGKVTNMSWISYLANIPTTNILVKGICLMKHLIHISYIANIHQDIGRWNVGKVTNMYWMFGGADAFDQNIGHWNVPRKVLSILAMLIIVLL